MEPASIDGSGKGMKTTSCFVCVSKLSATNNIYLLKEIGRSIYFFPFGSFFYVVYMSS